MSINVMLDLETMSVESNAAICSIGAVKFSVEDASSYTITSKLGGKFKADSALRAEFMALVRT